MTRFIRKTVDLFKYLLREDLDIRRKLLNLALLTIFVTQFPTIVFDFVVGSDIVGIIVHTLILPFAAYIIWDINKHPDSQRPLLMVCIVLNLVILPFMFFTMGGHKTGMMMWFIMGLAFNWVILNGMQCYIVFFLNCLVISGICIIEQYHPEYVSYLATENDELLDQVIAVLVVGLAFGILFKYQGYVYETQKNQLTEQEKALEETNKDLENASLAKSDFLASMSHEIRTPINAILGMDEMILKECTDEGIVKYALDIDSAGNQLLAIVNDILDFSKIESGKMEIHPAEYELYSIANDCYNMIFMRAKKRNLDFSIENDSELPSYLLGDEIRIRQIIVNLLTNAVKYTNHGWVKMKMYQQPMDDKNIMLCISVQDTGIGISPENIDRLFDSFERIDETKNRHVEGTGLGLAITKRFVDLMNGSIRVESEPGKGSTFTVEIPQQVASKEPMGDFAGRFAKRAESRIIKKKIFTAPTARVLVVDDVKMNLNVVRLLLKNTKIQVDMAQSGEECLSLSMLKTYDVVLMDHMMPDMDGIETLHKMREIKHGLNYKTPVIALTANALTGADELYLSEGFDGYLSKPIKGEVLEKALIKYIPDEKVVYETEE